MEFIYTVLIAPLEYWMRVVLEWGYGHSGSWGWSIVLMSVVVNTVILPIYMKAESWQEEEQRKRRGYEAKEAMIKRTFKGQERFAMITTMRRQAGYTTYVAMRSSVGFFLQIPFFFAAYHFLSQYEPLAGVSFLGLADLGKPDEAIDLWGLKINVMPIVMTVINVGSALVYTKGLAKRDKVQLYAMAALFLVLLYDAASGLVLYWTCNNIYSLLKNIVYDGVRRFSPCFEQVRIELPRSFAEEPRPTVYGFLPLLIWGGGLLFGVLSSTQIPFFDGTQRRILELTSNSFFAFSMAWCIKESCLLFLKKGRKPFSIFLLILCAGCLWYWYKGTFIRAKVFFTLLLGLWSMVPVLALTLDRYRPEKWLYPKEDPTVLYAPSAFWLVVLLCGYLPVQAYCTAPEIFSSPDVVLAKLLLNSACFGAMLYVAGCVWRVLGVLRTASVITAFVAVWFTVYAFVLPLDVGTIDGFQIEFPERLYRSINVFADVTLFLFLGAVFFLCFKYRAVSVLRITLTVACIGSFFAGIYQLWTVQGRWLSDTQSRRTELPAYNEQMLGFTQQGKNTLVFVLDMFSGRHVGEILEKDAELKEKLSGFVWYPDVLAQGTRTNTSIATLICGEDCTIGALNKGKKESLVDKINQRYATALEAFGNQTNIFVNEHNWLESQRFKRYAKGQAQAVRFLSSAYLNRYAKQHNLEVKVGGSDDFLSAVSLFVSVPWSLKSVVYFDGHWVTQAIGYWSSDRVADRLQEWAFLDQLPDISNAKAKSDTYKFFHSEITHYPWLMEPGKCGIVRNLAAGQNYPQQAVETCALKALARWFDWMKHEGVYDNTTIVVVSDHGADSSRLNPLLFVKPRNAARQPIVRDDSLVSLSDVPELAAGSFKQQSMSRMRYTYDMDKVGEDYYKGAVEYEVKGSIFDEASWPKEFPRWRIPR